MTEESVAETQEIKAGGPGLELEYAEVLLDALAEADADNAKGAEVILYVTEALEREGFEITRILKF